MNRPWVRENDGAIFGVCSGLAKRFEIDILLVRLAWVFSVFFFGFGLPAYIVLALSLPKEENLSKVQEPRVLGVASRFAKRFNLDIGLTRCLFLTALLCSGGSVFFIYILLHFIFPKNAINSPENY